MSDLGALLKGAREQKGYSLDDVQEMTKIRKRYLEAIEEGNYKVLPGNFYVRAFVKNFAETVGLDADEVLRLYQQEVPAHADHQQVPEQPILKPRRASSSQVSDRVSKWGFRLLMWSFIAVIAVVVYVYAINRDNGGGNKTADDTKITNQDVPPANNGNAAANNGAAGTGDAGGNANNTGGANQPSPTTPSPPAQQTALTLVEKMKRSTDRYTVAPAGPHKFKVAVTGSGSCWFEVRQGGRSGKSLFNHTEKSGALFSQEIDGTVYINVGRADLVEVKVDGQLLEDGDGARPKRFLIETAPLTTDGAADSAAAGTTVTQ